MRNVPFASIAAATLLCAACTVMDVKTEVIKTAADYKSAGRVPSAKIEVFEGKVPTAPYIEIALIKAEARKDVDQGELIKAMRDRAVRLGADAIVDVNFSEKLTPGGYGGQMVCPFDQPCTYMQTDSTVIGMPTAESKAIKYSK